VLSKLSPRTRAHPPSEFAGPSFCWRWRGSSLDYLVIGFQFFSTFCYSNVNNV